MRYLVAYDIRCPKRLRRVARLLNEYGIRIEKSVFVCEIPPQKARNLGQGLFAVSAPEDSILFFPLPTSVRCIPIRGELCVVEEDIGIY